MSPRSVLGLSLRDHIGGRWAISWQAYAINAPVSAVSVLTVIDLPTTARGWAAAVSVMVIGLGVIAAYFVTADRTLLRNRRTRPVAISVVVLLGVAIGMTRAVAVHASASALGLVTGQDELLLLRVLWAGALGGVMLPLGALLLSSISCFRRERRRLLEERAGVERHLLEQEGVLDALSAAVADEVREEIRREIADLPVGELTPMTASEAVRRTSHRLWDGPGDGPRQRSDARRDVRRVLGITLQRQSLPPVAIPVVWAVAAVPTIVGNVGGLLAVVNIAFSCLAIWAALRLTSMMAARRPRRRVWFSALGLLLAAVMTGPVAYLLFDPRPLADGIPMFLANLLWLLCVAAVITLASGALASGEQVLRSLAEDITDDEVRARSLETETEQLLREIAARLHGTVHSPVVARAALAVSSDDDELRQRLIDSVGQLTLVDVMGDDATLRDCLAATVEPRLPLVDVTVEVDGPEAVRPPSAGSLRSVASTVDEAIANAYRHGGATSLEIRAEVRRDLVIVTVVDDGRGVASGGDPGLGSRLFDAMAPGA